METNDERRREVAANLREYDVAEFKESTIVPFLECLGYGYKGWRGILDELADLIDPTCVMTPQGDGFRCSSCGTCHDMSGFDEFPWPHCPECGARVVSR